MALNGITRRKAGKNTGGIAYALISEFTPGMVEIVDGVATITGGTFKRYDVNKETSGLATNFTLNPGTGSAFDEQTLTLVFSDGDGDDVATEVRELAKIEILAIVVDYNGNNKVVGSTRGADMTAAAGGTGVALGDLNGQTVTIVGKEPEVCPKVLTLPTIA